MRTSSAASWFGSLEEERQARVAAEHCGGATNAFTARMDVAGSLRHGCQAVGCEGGGGHVTKGRIRARADGRWFPGIRRVTSMNRNELELELETEIRLCHL